MASVKTTIRQKIRGSYGPVVVIMSSEESEKLILLQYQRNTWYELLKGYTCTKDKIPIKDLQGRITMHSEFPIKWISWNDMDKYVHSDTHPSLEPVILSALEQRHTYSPPSIDSFVQYGIDLFSDISLQLMYNSDKNMKLQLYEGELLDHPVSIILFISLKDYSSPNQFLDTIKNLITRFTEEYALTKEGWMESNILFYYTLVYHPDQQHDALLDQCFNTLRNAHGLNTCLFQLDRSDQETKKLDHFIFDFTKNHLVPYMERTILHLNTQLSTYRKSTASRIFSASKKYFSTGGFRSGTTSPTEPTSTLESSTKPHFRFHRDTPDFQMRRLADYAFMLRDYKLCYTALDSLKKDFQIPKNSQIILSVMEWMYIASLMNDSLALDDRQHFDTYSMSYHRMKLYTMSFRSLYIHLESLLERQLYTDAFSSLQRLTGSDTPDIINALLLERVAVIFLSLALYQPMKRKAMFYYTLSSHHYEKTNNSLLIYHACRTEEYALFLLSKDAWTTLHDHLHYTIGKLSRDQQQWSKALYHTQRLVKDTRNFYRPFQSSYIREFLHLNITSMEWFTDIDIPSVDLNSISIENYPAICIDHQFSIKLMNDNNDNVQYAISRQDTILIGTTMTNHSIVKYSIHDISLMIQQEDETFIQGTVISEVEFINSDEQHIVLSFDANTLPINCSSFRILGLSYHLGQQSIPIYRELYKCRDILYMIIMEEQTLNIVWKGIDNNLEYDGSESLLSLNSKEIYQGQLFYRQLNIDMNNDRLETDFQFKLIYKNEIALDIPFHADTIPSNELDIKWNRNIGSFSNDKMEWKSINNSSTILLYVTDCINQTILYPPISLVLRYTIKSKYRYMMWSLYDDPISIIPILNITCSSPFYDIDSTNETCQWNTKFLVDCSSIKSDIHVTNIQTIGLRHVLNDSSIDAAINHLNSSNSGSLPDHCRFMLTVQLKNRNESLSHLNQILEWLRKCLFIHDSKEQEHVPINPIHSGSNTFLPDSLLLKLQVKKRREYIRGIFQNEISESKIIDMMDNVIPVLDHQSFLLLLSWELSDSDIKGVSIANLSIVEQWYSYFESDWIESKLESRSRSSDTLLFTQGIQDRKRIIKALTINSKSSLHSRLAGYMISESVISAVLYMYNESICKSVNCQVLLDQYQNSIDDEPYELSTHFHWFGQQIHDIDIEPLQSKSIKLEGLLLPNPVYSSDEKRVIQLHVWIIDNQFKRKESCMIIVE